MPESRIRAHTTDNRPVPRNVGAIVTLRNGENAVVSPYPPGEKYRFSTVWFRLGDEGDEKGEDIVSFQVLKPTDGDRLLWDVLKLFDVDDDPLKSEDPMSKRIRAEMRRRTRSAIETYLHEWPTTPETKGLRKLERWFDQDEE